MIVLYSWSLVGEDIHISIKKIQTSDVVLMNTAYGSSGSFWSRVRSKFIGHNTYIGRRSSFHSKTRPIHGPDNKYYLIFLNSISHFRWLPQAFS